MKIGFIGTGKIASSVITGICNSKISFSRILISPRNKDIASSLKKKFKKIIIAKNNQDLVDSCNWIFLSVTPTVGQEIIKKIKDLKNFKLIFSAHGLPEKNIKKGDPYQWQVEQSVNKIVKSLNIENLDWVLSYQSRVGPLKWIGPSTEDIIVENSKLGKHIVLVPIAFVSEHSETLVELDIEYKELADKNGCKNYTRVPALGTNENYIKAMSNLIINKQDYNFNGELFPPKIQCPNQFIKCPCLNYE